MALYQDEVDNLKRLSLQKDHERHIAKQLLIMHEEAKRRENPVVVELGTHIGNSTRCFLNAIDDKESACLISLDIVDCSDVAASEKWIFVQQDSADVEALAQAVPNIKEGIDILYVDSLHEHNHVKNEIYNFFPYMKEGGVIFFDDTDSGSYMILERKDNVKVEIANRRIHKLLDKIFSSNIESLDYTVHRGSTGLSRFDILSPLGSTLKPPSGVFERNSLIFWSPWLMLTYIRRKLRPQEPRKRY